MHHQNRDRHVALLQDKDNLTLILKGGVAHKLDRTALDRQEVRAAE